MATPEPSPTSHRLLSAARAERKRLLRCADQSHIAVAAEQVNVRVDVVIGGDSVKDEIYEYNKKIDDWQHKLDNEQSEINTRIYNGKKCIDARVEMAKIFGEAYYNADHESDPNIVTEAHKLLPYWAEEQKSHNEALGNAQTAVRKCGEMR